MLLTEILAPKRALTATLRFRETFKTFKAAYPSLDKALMEFIVFRMDHGPETTFGAKDRPFTNRLRGFWHYHLVHGRAILIYQISQQELKLFCITDHNYSTKQGENKLNTFVHGDHEFTQLRTQPPQPTLSPPQVQLIRDLFFEFAADPDVTKEIKSVSDLMEYVRLVIDEPEWSDQQKDAAAFAAFGGKDELLAAMRQALHRSASRV